MNSNSPANRFVAQVASVCAVAAGVLAVIGVASWPLGKWRQLAFGGEYVPMAPATALLMLLLSVAAFLRARPSSNRAARIAEAVCALLVLGGGILFGLRILFGFNLPVEDWLSRTTETVGGIPLGRMSPLAAGCFVVAATALLCGHLGTTRWRPLRSLSGGLGLAVLAMSGIIVIGYVAGTPFLYGGSTIPMALLTGVALALASAATLLGAGGDAWPVRMFLRRSTEDEDDAAHRVEWSLLVLFLALAAGIAFLGVSYLNHRQADARSTALAQLESIADLKVQQIVNWRKERLSDGAFFSRAPFVAQDVARLLATPKDAKAEADVLAWLTLLKGGQRYERVVVFDSLLRPRLTLPSWTNEVGPMVRAHLVEALRTNAVLVSDLHGGDTTEDIRMDMLLPVFAQDRRSSPDAQASTNASVPIAILLLQIDPRQFLYPLLQTWPTPSPTAETLLVRREGQEILYLNELRHQKGTAMTLRRPLGEARLPAAMGLRGGTGVYEGMDYRGVPVVAAVRAVPDTAWVMVAKVDESELYAQLRQDALTVVVVALALLLAAMLGITVLWRRRNEHFLRAQLTTERERRALAERFEHLMKNASDAILLADEQGGILEANHRALAIYGFSLAELQAIKLPELRPVGARGDVLHQIEEVAATGHAEFESLHRRKDGSVFPVEVSSRMVEIGETSYQLAIVRDITQRKAHEAEIERLNRLYATLSQVNQTIVRRQSREELFADICRVAVEFGRFKAAWIGRKVADSEPVTTVAHYASGPDAALARPGLDGRCGVMGEAVRTGRPCLCNDSQTDERAACCRQVLAGLGVQACAAFPLRLRGEVCGGFSICSIEPSFFNAAETRLLDEVTSAISFALDRLHNEEQRQRAEEALLASEVRYRRLFEAAQDGILILDAETGMIVNVNPFLVKLLGFSHEQFLGKKVWELGFFKDIIANESNFAELQQQEYIRYDDKPLETADGRRIDVEFVSNVYRVNHHKVIQCNIRDISERKRAEVQLRKLSRAVAQSPASVVITDLLGNIEYVNPKFEQVTGYALAEVLGQNSRVLKSGETPAEAYAELWRTITGGGEWSGEFHNRRKDGSLFWERAVISGIRDDKGRVTHFLAVKEDITDRKRAEAQLREREERLRLAMDASSMGTWDRDLTTNALHWSDTEERLMGYAPGTFPGTNEAFMELVHPDSLAILLAAQQRVRTGDGVYHAELRFRCKDGRDRWGLLCGKKILDESGRALRIVGVDMDITERKRAEQILRDSQELYSSLVENLPQSVFRKDREGRFLFCNERFCESVGRSCEEIIGQTDADLFPPQLAAAYRQDDLRVMESGETLEQVEDYTGADGQKRFVQVVKTPLHDASGAIVGIQGIFSDITERKQVEDLLARERWLMRTLIDRLPDGIYVKDLAGRFLLANRAVAQFMGAAAPEDLLGRTDVEFYPEAAAAVFRADEARVFAGQPLLNKEETVQMADGGERCLLTSKLPFQQAEGPVIGLIGISRDITERKRIEEALRENEALLRESQVIAGLGSYVLEIATGRWTSSDVLDEVLGIDKDYNRTVEGWEALIHPDDRAMMADYLGNEVLGRRQFFNKEYRIIRRNDRAERWVCGLGRLELDAQGRPVKMRGTIQEITERKRLEQERAAMEVQLRQRQKLESIGTLAGGVAHEINNPINGIMNYAQLIQDRLEAGSPLTEYTGEILHETQRVATIVRNLLTFARNEKQSHSPARMADIIEGTLSLIRTVIRHDQITLNVKVPQDLPNLNCRSQQLQQVLMNLMTNARDALNERYPGHDPDKVLNVTAGLFEKEGRRWIRVTVEDHGTGTAPEVRERMFDPFFTTKPRDQGTGLGLAISHGIVKEHDGELTVESEPGRFTRMHVDLPVDPV